jgi:hypothetical protein
MQGMCSSKEVRLVYLHLTGFRNVCETVLVIMSAYRLAKACNSMQTLRTNVIRCFVALQPSGKSSSM